MIHVDDSWARVELFRWQYGELPNGDDTRRLDVRKALANMAQAIDDGCKAKDASKMPKPHAVIAILQYCSRHMPTGDAR